MSDIIHCSADSPLPIRTLALLKDCMDHGSVIIFPTNTQYGLGASIHSVQGISKVNRLKSRPAGMPLSIMANVAQIEKLCIVPDSAMPFIERGDVLTTAVLPASSQAPEMLVHNGTLAVRLPCSALTASIVEIVGPITATSANIHGTPTPTDISGAIGQFGDEISFYIDSGTLDGEPTSIVDYTGKRPKIIRKSAISEEAGKSNE